MLPPSVLNLFVTMQVVIAYTVGVAAMLAAFWATPASAVYLQWAVVFLIGFFLYGPQAWASAAIAMAQVACHVGMSPPALFTHDSSQAWPCCVCLDLQGHI